MGNNYLTRKNIVVTIVTFFTVLGVFGQATLESDLPDYAPGSTATFTGNGFEPGEFVKMLVLHADDVPNTGQDHEIWYVTANVFGSFVTTWHVCEDDCLGSTLRAYAEGQSSGLQAFVEFTDAITIWTNPINFNNPNVSNPYTSEHTFDPKITVSGIGRGSGIAGQNGNGRYNADGWNSTSVNLNDYFYFTLTPVSGYHIKFNNFIYTGQTSPQGPTSFAFRSDANGDNYTTSVGTPTSSGATISLTAGQFQNVTSAIDFRLYGWNASNATGTFSVNSFTFGAGILGTSFTSLSGFSTCINVASPGQQFDVIGVGLTPNSPITVAPSANYELSTTSAIAGFQGTNSIVFNTDGVGAVSKSVWVRLKANPTANSYNGEVINVSGGGFLSSDNVNVTVNGSVQGIACSINGTEGPICPSSSNVYSAAAGMNSYAWSLTNPNGAIITSAANAQNVTVQAGTGNNTSYTVSLTIVKDGCSSTCTKTVTVNDNTAPVLAAPPPAVSVQCIGDVPAIANLNWSDNCDAGGSVASVDGPLVGGNCGGTITRTWNVSDACGNPAETRIQIIMVNDDIVPVLAAAPPAVSVQCIGDVPAIANLNWSDNCDAGGSVASVDGPLVGGNCGGTITRTWNVSDACGNPAETRTQIITVNDDIVPVLDAAPLDVSVQCIGDVPAMTDLTWTDNCSAGGSVAGVDAPLVGGNCGGTITRTWNVSDACGNPAETRIQIITVKDDIAPILVCPTISPFARNTDLNLCTYKIQGAEFNATATDNCSTPVLTWSVTGATTISGTGSIANAILNKGANIINWTATDACNNASSNSIIVNVNDVVAPSITPPANKTCASDMGLCTKTFTLAEIGSPTYSDNCSATVSWVRSDGQTLLNAPFSFGTTTITWTATDLVPLTTSCIQTITIDKITTTSAVTVTPSPQQYSDKVTFVANVAPCNCPAVVGVSGSAAGVIGGTVAFKIGTQAMGSAPVVGGVATLSNVALLEPTPFGTLPIGQLSQGIKTVKACFSGTDADYVVIDPTTSLEITKENAVADYTGQDFASTGTATSTSSLVRLSATIRDITSVTPGSDSNGGDIRYARARFKLRGVNPSNGSEAVPEFSTDWMNVTLLGADVKVGSILKDLTLTIPGSLESVIFEIKVEVGDNGYYCNSDAAAIIGTLTLSKSLNDFVTFGGNLKMTPNNSFGSYPSNNDSKINFGGSVKYNKNGTNMQGGVNIIWRTGTKTYQIKGIVGGSNGSMSVNIANANEKKAVVTAKANVYDTETGLAVVGISGAIVTLNLVDKGEPGVNDQISIELRNGSGLLLLSSKWTGIKTDLLVLTGGNIQVKSTSTVSSVRQEEVPEETASSLKLPFNIKAYPNPSSQYFNLNIEGNDGEDAEIMVYNSAGILIDQFKQKVNQENQLGSTWARGMYLIQIKKGVEVKTIKLLKNN